jgi:hypothetical protein
VLSLPLPSCTQTSLRFSLCCKIAAIYFYSALSVLRCRPAHIVAGRCCGFFLSPSLPHTQSTHLAPLLFPSLHITFFPLTLSSVHTHVRVHTHIHFQHEQNLKRYQRLKMHRLAAASELSVVQLTLRLRHALVQASCVYLNLCGRVAAPREAASKSSRGLVSAVT